MKKVHSEAQNLEAASSQVLMPRRKATALIVTGILSLQRLFAGEDTKGEKPKEEKLREIGVHEFRTFIEESKLPALVMFSHKSCPNCRALEQLLVALQKRYNMNEEQIYMVKLSISEDIGTDIVYRQPKDKALRRVPFSVFFYKGNAEFARTGAQGEDAFVLSIDKIIALHTKAMEEKTKN